MPFPFAAIARAVAPSLIGALFGGGGGGGSSQSAAQSNPQLAQQSAAETALLEQQQQLISQLMERANNYTGGPIGQLDLPDSRFLDEDFLGSLEPSRDIELLQSLLGRSVGSGATGALASLDQRRQESADRARESQGQSIAGILDSLITGFQNRQQANQPSATEVFDQYAGRQFF